MKRLRLAPWVPITAYQLFGINDNLSDLKIDWPAESQETTDFLTGIPVRKAYDKTINEAIIESGKQNAAFGLIIIDLDKFKAVNDQYGHLAGDHVLKEFASRARGVLRREDFIARYGGEEFVILTLCYKKTFDLGERVRKAICAHPFIFQGISLNITCSFGCSVFPLSGLTTGEVFEKADKALYRAKENGRNQGQRG